MVTILWGILNIGLFITFIFICFSATKLVKAKLGRLAAVIFVFGLLSFVAGSGTHSGNQDRNSNNAKNWVFVAPDSLDKNNSAFTEVDLEKDLISTYGLGIQYGKHKLSQKNVPFSASTWVAGFIAGKSWHPIAVTIDPVDDAGKIRYDVTGTVEWKLLGLTTYSQPKKWTGIVLLK